MSRGSAEALPHFKSYVQFYLRRTFTRTVVRILTVTLAMASTLPSICRLRQLGYRSLLRRESYNCIIRWTSQDVNKEMAVCCHCHSDADYLRLFLVEMRTLTFVSERVLTLTIILLMARSSFPITALVRDLLGRTDVLYVTRPVASIKEVAVLAHCHFSAQIIRAF